MTRTVISKSEHCPSEDDFAAPNLYHLGKMERFYCIYLCYDEKPLSVFEISSSFAGNNSLKKMTKTVIF